MRRFVHQAISFGAWGAAMVFLAAPAQGAAKKPNVCGPAYTAYKAAITAEKAGRFREARDSLTTCAQSHCGGLAPKCMAAYAKLKAEMPSVVFLVTDASGTPVVDVDVKLDGDPVTSHLDGKAVPVEPGLHEFSFAMNGAVFETRKVMVLEGQQNRVISVSRQSPGAHAATAGGVAEPAGSPAPSNASSDKPASEASPAEHASHEVLSSTTASGTKKWSMPHSALPYALGGVGVVAVAAGGLLTYWGNKDNTELKAQCAPSCNPASVDHIHTMYIASDVAFGVGAAALGVTALLFATSRSAERAPAPASAVLGVAPTRSGAVASVSGSF